MYTTIIHPLRKMYCLSINEYCILDAVKNLSNNTKYNGWCVLSIPTLAKALDLSESTVKRGYAKLQEIELLIKRNENPQDSAVRPTDEWNEWFMPEKADILLGMKTNTKEIVCMLPKPTSEPTPSKLNPLPVQNEPSSGFKMNPYIYNNTNSDTKSSTTRVNEIWELLKFKNENLKDGINSLIKDYSYETVVKVARKLMIKSGGDEGSRWIQLVNWTQSETTPENKLKHKKSGIAITH